MIASLLLAGCQLATAAPVAEIEPNSSFATARVVPTAEPSLGIVTIGGELSATTLDADFANAATLAPGGTVTHGYAGLTARHNDAGSR
jgi:hypothetical protein